MYAPDVKFEQNDFENEISRFINQNVNDGPREVLSKKKKGELSDPSL